MVLSILLTNSLAMKSLKLFPFLFVLILYFGYSCKLKTESVCTISGNAANYGAKEVYITIDGKKDTLRIAEDGTFTREFTIADPSDATFQGERLFLYLYLEPGKSLGINFDGKAFDSLLKFTGDLSLPNKYLHGKTLESSSQYRRLSQLYKAPYTPDDYKKVRDSISKTEYNYLEIFRKDNPGLSEKFVKREQKALEFSVYYDLYSYPRMVGYYNTNAPVIPSDWYSFLNNINLDDPSLTGISDIRSFISLYVQQEALKKSGIPDEKSWGNPVLLRAMFDFVKEHFKSLEIYSVVLYDKLKTHIDSEGTTGIEDIVNEYLAKSINESYKARIKEISDKWTALAPGKPAPPFTLLNIKGEEVSLSDFRGKYIFIDFWATWCGPCLAEIPAYKQLVADYKGRNIVFISMSVDKEKPKWEAMIKANEYDWIQIHDPVRVNKKYLVMYIPTFTFIDPEGKIINARCPRPSDPELRKLFDRQPGL